MDAQRVNRDSISDRVRDISLHYGVQTTSGAHSIPCGTEMGASPPPPNPVIKQPWNEADCSWRLRIRGTTGLNPLPPPPMPSGSVA
jgi:hypothetical protein